MISKDSDQMPRSDSMRRQLCVYTISLGLIIPILKVNTIIECMSNSDFASSKAKIDSKRSVIHSFWVD